MKETTKKITNKIFFPFKWLFKKINDGIYNFKVLLHQKFYKKKQIKPEHDKMVNKIRDLVFYCAMFLVPLFFFVLTKIILQFESIALAFQKMTIEGKRVFAGFENFAAIFENFKVDPNYRIMLKNGLIVYLITTLWGFIPIIFSFYIYRKMFGYNFFKVIMFIPTILSSIITVSMFKMIANEVLPQIIFQITGKRHSPFLADPHTSFQTLIFYTIWMGFGSGLLTQLAAMNTVDVSVRESAQLEGVTFFQEFWHIALPASYQVIMLGTITGVGSIFAGTLNAYAFFGSGAPSNLRTIGYYFQVRTIEATNAEYHYLAAWGILTTIIVTPITLLLKHIVFTYGPSEDTHEKKRKNKKI